MSRLAPILNPEVEDLHTVDAAANSAPGKFHRVTFSLDSVT